MKALSIEELKKQINQNLMEEEKDIIAASLAFHLLNEEINIEFINNFGIDIVNRVNIVINKDRSTKTYIRVNKLLEQIIRNKAIETSKDFSLEEFLKKEDIIESFKYKCEYNRKGYKAALGLITPNQALYCDVPIGNHAEMVSAYYKDDPEYAYLNLQSIIHPEKPNWHEKVMEEKNAVIIHFMPNEFGAVIYIPNELTEFQYSELVKISETLIKNEVKPETNYEGLTLDKALSDTSFREKHGLPKEVKRYYGSEKLLKTINLNIGTQEEITSEKRI